jgi:hypothetical protein
VTSTRFVNPADYRNRFFHLSMNEKRSSKFVKSSQNPQPCQNRVVGLKWHMPCSLFV